MAGPTIQRALRGRRGAPFAGLAALLAGVLLAGAHPAHATPPHVILISLDGTRPADVTEADLGAVAALRAEGAAARSMIGVIPSNTFPSHVSLATGVAPERHGLVNNRFVDPHRGVFEKQDIPTWIEVEPIWSWLAGRGIVSASFYWVGSEGPWPGTGRGPRHWKPFSSRTPEREKVDQILAWIDLPAGEAHPRLITSWFHGADHAGHHEGPGTEAVRKQLRRQNVAIERLIAGLEARGAFAWTTLIFVSDHGMVGAERTVNLGRIYGRARVSAKVSGIGGFATVNVADGPGRAERVRRAVALAREQGLRAHARTEAPADWRVDHPRFGDVVVRAPVGTAIVYSGLSLAGYHGYPPEEPSMRAILLARGRGARPGTDLGVVRIVDVAPTVAHLLGELPPAWMEGRVIEGLRVDDGSAAGDPAPSGNAAGAPARGPAGVSAREPARRPASVE